MALKLGVVFFSGVDRADEILTAFRTLHPEDFWVENVGIVERRKRGHIGLYGSFGFDQLWEEEGEKPTAGVAGGGMTGLLIGTFAGAPGMAVGGLIGAALGGLLGAADEEGTDRRIFDVIKSKLEKDSSALVLLSDAEYVDELIKDAGKSARDVYQQNVREELRGRLEEAVREAAEHPIPRTGQQPGPQPSMH
jgi:uncharacterized membrane protein